MAMSREKPEPRYELRGATLEDEAALHEVARHLNTVNLPDEREGIRQILEIAHRSFTGAIKDARRRQYVFVLVDKHHSGGERIIGTSMIFGQLGRRDAPYIYFDVIDEERYSATLDKHFKHTTLKIGYSYNGPTEIGGLVLHPDYRRVPERLGTFISYVRFLYIKLHRAAFRDEVLAELLPPLEEDGTSHLWEALGRHFTELTYAEADKLSRKNKEFIRGLFPEGAFYATLLPKDAQDVIGRVGAQTRGVEKLLRRIGFRYAERVDPFDGGPHFTAATDEITLVRDTKERVLVRLLDDPGGTRRRAVVGVEVGASPFFRAVLAPYEEHGEEGAAIGAPEARALGLEVGKKAWILPLE